MVRPATHDDVAMIVALGAQFHGSVPALKGLPFCFQSAAEFAHAAVDGDDMLLLCMTTDDGSVVGFFLGVLQPAYWNRATKIAQQISFFVLPEHRQRPGAVRMVLEFERWAKQHGAAVIASGAKSPRVGELMGRLGYVAAETMMMKRLEA